MRVLGILVLMAIAVPASAQRVLRVPTQFGTIGAAVTAAVASDVVLVGPGTYNERVHDQGKAITIISEQGARLTSIAGSALPTGTVWLTAGSVDGFTITGPFSPSVVRVDMYGRSTLRNCIVENGGFCGVWVHGPATIERNEIRFCDELGGIYVHWNAGPVAIRENFVHDCYNSDYLDRGAGMTVNAAAVVEDNVIMQNASQGVGGGIWANPGATIRNNVIASNVRGGIAIGYGSSSGPPTIIEGNFIIGNQSTFGGGIDCAPIRSPIELRSNLVINNTGGGVVLECHDTVVVTLVNNTVVGNAGGGLHLNGTFRLLNSIVAGNGPAEVTFQKTLYVGNSFIPRGKLAVVGSTNHTLNWGPGNIASSDPGFIDVSRLDFRLRADSVCVDAGDANAPIGTVDNEGDPRLVGTRPDIGADELYANIRVTSVSALGGDLTIVGEPGKPAWLGIAQAAGPLRILPGITGQLALDLATLGAVPLGLTPASGVLTIRLPAVRGTWHVQALIGSTLSSARVMTIR